jgi:hypothetical protein
MFQITSVHQISDFAFKVRPPLPGQVYPFSETMVRCQKSLFCETLRYLNDIAGAVCTRILVYIYIYIYILLHVTSPLFTYYMQCFVAQNYDFCFEISYVTINLTKQNSAYLIVTYLSLGTSVNSCIYLTN